MTELLKFIWSKTSYWQKLFLYVSINSPLFLAFIICIVKFFFNIQIISPLSIAFMFIIWLLSFISFSGLILIFHFLFIRNKDFAKNKSKIANSMTNLLKNRLEDGKNSIVILLCLMILSFYILAFIPKIVAYYHNDLPSAAIVTYSFVILFLLFTNTFINIFIGLQEKTLNRYVIILSLFFIWSFYFILNFLQIFPPDLLKKIEANVSWIIPTIITLIAPIVIATWKSKKNLPKKENVGWEKSIYSDMINDELFFVYFFLIFILMLWVSHNGFKDTLSFNRLLVIMTLFATLLLCICYSVLDRTSKTFIKNMIDWNKFFDCYNGSAITALGEYPKQLIKVSGKCRAISIDENYKKKIDPFNQHFLLEIDGSKEEIDVISLEEKSPFINTQNLVKESDEIVIIGEMKSVLNDETLCPNDNRISELILAYHVEERSDEDE